MARVMIPMTTAITAPATTIIETATEIRADRDANRATVPVMKGATIPTTPRTTVRVTIKDMIIAAPSSRASVVDPSACLAFCSALVPANCGV